MVNAVLIYFVIGMFFWNYTAAAIGSSVTRFNLNFSKVSYVRLAGRVLREVGNVDSAVRCSVLCAGTVSCQSFNYSGAERYCQLNVGTKTIYPWIEVTGESCCYYEMDTLVQEPRTKKRHVDELYTNTEQTAMSLPANGPTTEELTSIKERITSKEPSTETPTTTPLSETVQSTCSAFRDIGYTVDGYYMIDPDGPEDDPEFLVYCEMTTVGVTVVSNTLRNQMITVPVNEDSYEVDIKYYTSEDQIKALIDQSSTCNQFLMASCRNVKLWEGSTQLSWWVSGEGDQMRNWGGAPTGTEGCSCQLTQECAGGPTSLCNCGSVADEWATDEGILSDKDRLPVSALHFINTAPSGDLVFRLGSLKCM